MRSDKHKRKSGFEILTVIILFAAVVFMVFTFFSMKTVDKNDRNLFGYKVFSVMSDSMSATDFNAGDLVFSKVVDPSTLQAGDIISYISVNDYNYGEVVTHKIRRLTFDENGEKGFVTYGTTTDTDDEAVVTYPYILGKYVGSIPKMGYFFTFMKTVPGYLLCILLPFGILILINGIQSVKLFREYKKAKTAELDKERAQLEKEREDVRQMMEEMNALKAQLYQSGVVPGAALQNSDLSGLGKQGESTGRNGNNN